MRINAIHQNRMARIGRAGGMIWMVFITFFFAILDLYYAGLPVLPMIGTGVAILVITGVLLTWSMNTLRTAIKMPVEKSEEKNQRGRSIRKWFLIVLFLEIAGLNIATFTLMKLHYYQYIVPADILIVALHFLPLGRIFVMPVYYFLGIAVALIDLLTLIFVPVSSQIGNLPALTAIPSLSFILLNWILIVYILWDHSNRIAGKLERSNDLQS